MRAQMELDLAPSQALPGDLFRDCAVPASSLEDFLGRFYRHDRYKGRGPEYAACVLESHRETLAEFGMDWIGQYESLTGSVVAYYPEASS